MKIAAQTVIWGNRVADMTSVLNTLANNGCEGVEFSQRPEQLPKIVDLKRMLSDRRLAFVGLSGGTLIDRMRFCGDERPEYLYVEDWDDWEAPEAIKQGFTLALHPHVFKRVHRLSEATKLMEQHPELLFLPDLAHLHIAGDLATKALLLFRDRLAAVHVKDWTPEHGRSSHRYARGFTQLGRGIVKIPHAISLLSQIDYKGWLVFEQASREDSPEQTVSSSTRWLSRLTGRMLSRRTPITTPTRNKNESQKAHDRTWTVEAEHNFLETVLHSASEDVPRCYPALAKAIRRLIGCKLVMLGGCSPSADIIGILSVAPSTTKLDDQFISYRGSLSSVALERQAVTSFDLSSPKPGLPYGRSDAKFGYPALLKLLRLQRLVSVPVLNSVNPHQARLVMGLFFDEDGVVPDPDELVRIGNYIAQAADSALDERCSLAAASASFIAGRCQQVSAFLDEIRGLLLEVLRCEALTIFLVNDAGDRLESAVSTGLNWKVERRLQFYGLGEGLTGFVWEQREAILSTAPQKHPNWSGKSEESHSGMRRTYLCSPLLGASGDVVGVVRCQNKMCEAGTTQMFSEDDVSVLEAVGQAAVPHLQVLLSKERRANALRRLTHELHTPLYAMIGALKFMRRDLHLRPDVAETLFREDYIKDIEGWVAMMRGLVGNADFLRLTSRELAINRKRVHLYADIFMPAIRQTSELLYDRGFSPNRITISPFEEIPALWADKHFLHQVAFNLLNNAIKYAHDEPSRFRINIQGTETDDEYHVYFRDWGPGVPETMREAIFEEGVRSKEARNKNVAGDGLGLYVARRILEGHGGRLELTSCFHPTEFMLAFPKRPTARK